jgi:hypothetical protein
MRDAHTVGFSVHNQHSATDGEEKNYFDFEIGARFQ